MTARATTPIEAHATARARGRDLPDRAPGPRESSRPCTRPASAAYFGVIFAYRVSVTERLSNGTMISIAVPAILDVTVVDTSSVLPRVPAPGSGSGTPPGGFGDRHVPPVDPAGVLAPVEPSFVPFGFPGTCGTGAGSKAPPPLESPPVDGFDVPG